MKNENRKQAEEDVDLIRSNLTRLTHDGACPIVVLALVLVPDTRIPRVIAILLQVGACA